MELVDGLDLSTLVARGPVSVADALTRMLVIGNGGAATADAGPPQIHIVQHWFAELKRLVPTD